jgi:hypothetical protein
VYDAESRSLVVAASSDEQRLLSQADHFAGAAQPAAPEKQKAAPSQLLTAPQILSAEAVVDSPNRARKIGAELEIEENWECHWASQLLTAPRILSAEAVVDSPNRAPKIGAELEIEENWERLPECHWECRQQQAFVQADENAGSGCDERERPPGADDAKSWSVATGSDELRHKMPLTLNTDHVCNESRRQNTVADANAAHVTGSCMAQVRNPRTKSRSQSVECSLAGLAGHPHASVRALCAATSRR